MNSELDRQACTIRCWWMGAAVALVLAFVLWIFAGFTLLTALIIGIILGAAAGAVLVAMKCRDSEVSHTKATDRKSAPETTGAAMASTSMAAGAGAAVAEPDPALVEEPNAAGTTSAVEFVSDVPEPQPVLDPNDVGQPEGVPVEHAPEEITEPTFAPVAADGAPEVLDAPRASGADSLQQITGVGPKMEETLNELGIYHFDQIASWGESEIDWVDARLRFKGRIRRDDWVAQARALGNGGANQ